jgi:hypothetical protein
VCRCRAAAAVPEVLDSGEINSRVRDQHGAIEEIAAELSDGRQDRLDGPR